MLISVTRDWGDEYSRSLSSSLCSGRLLLYAATTELQFQKYCTVYQIFHLPIPSANSWQLAPLCTRRNTFFSLPHSRLAHSPRSAAHCPPLLTPSRVRISLFARTRETCSMRNMREEVLKLLKETLPSVCHANKVMQKEASQSPVNCQCSASWRIIRKLHTCPVAAALEIFMGERARTRPLLTIR